MTDDGREVVEIVAGVFCLGKECQRNCPDVDHAPCPDAIYTWREKAEQILTAIEASGRWKIVPVEPTDEIVGVLKSPIYGPLNPQTVAVSLEEGRQRWRDALSASPKATHTAEEGK